MNAEELRAIIWDELFRAKTSRSVDEIAVLTDHDASDVRSAVNHEWFTLRSDQVSIAMAPRESQYHR
jgi:hypothetical protein